MRVDQLCLSTLFSVPKAMTNKKACDQKKSWEMEIENKNCWGTHRTPSDFVWKRIEITTNCNSHGKHWKTNINKSMHVIDELACETNKHRISCLTSFEAHKMWIFRDTTLRITTRHGALNSKLGISEFDAGWVRSGWIALGPKKNSLMNELYGRIEKQQRSNFNRKLGSTILCTKSTKKRVNVHPRDACFQAFNDLGLRIH